MRRNEQIKYKSIVIRCTDGALKPLLIHSDSGMPVVLTTIWMTHLFARGQGKFNTVKSYLEDIKSFYLWADNRQIDIYERFSSLLGFTLNEIKSLAQALKTRRDQLGTVSPATFNRRLIAIEDFCDFHMQRCIDKNWKSNELYKKGLSQQKKLKSFLCKLKYSRIDVENGSTPTKAFSTEQIKLISAAISPNSEINNYRGDHLKVRNFCMFHLALEAWMRRGELILLETSDLDLGASPTVKIKSPKAINQNKRLDGASIKTYGRISPISCELSELLQLYLSEYRPMFVKPKSPSTALFLNERDGQRLSCTSCSRIISRIKILLPQLNIEASNIHPHMLRVSGSTIFREHVTNNPVSNSDIVNHGQLQDMMTYMGGWSSRSNMPRKYSQTAIARRIAYFKREIGNEKND